jgi:hypothetical protein
VRIFYCLHDAFLQAAYGLSRCTLFQNSTEGSVYLSLGCCASNNSNYQRSSQSWPGPGNVVRVCQFEDTSCEDIKKRSTLCT